MWVGDKIVAKAVRYQDSEERKEAVVTTMRKRWAEEFLFTEL